MPLPACFKAASMVASALRACSPTLSGIVIEA
jgi:hypothetical protein